jgi:hypothetical protein
MKNTLNFLFVMAIMVFIIGCNCKFGQGGQSEPTQDRTNQPSQPTTSQNENKSQTDQPTSPTAEGDKIGVPECDELMDYFKNKIDNENTDYFTKAVLKTLEARFREGIKKSLEENKSDKTETAKWCKEFKKNLDEQEAKQQK